MLNGYSAQQARRKAPPAAEKTEESKGALIPRAAAIVTANSRSKTPLKKAVSRCSDSNEEHRGPVVDCGFWYELYRLRVRELTETEVPLRQMQTPLTIECRSNKH